jgi:hypothetical protein
MSWLAHRGGVNLPLPGITELLRSEHPRRRSAELLVPLRG